MERQCNHGKGVCFIEKERKNELKKIKEMMYATQKNRDVRSHDG